MLEHGPDAITAREAVTVADRRAGFAPRPSAVARSIHSRLVTRTSCGRKRLEISIDGTCRLTIACRKSGVNARGFRGLRFAVLTQALTNLTTNLSAPPFGIFRWPSLSKTARS